MIRVERGLLLAVREPADVVRPAERLRPPQTLKADPRVKDQTLKGPARIGCGRVRAMPVHRGLFNRGAASARQACHL